MMMRSPIPAAVVLLALLCSPSLAARSMLADKGADDPASPFLKCSFRKSRGERAIPGCTQCVNDKPKCAACSAGYVLLPNGLCGCDVGFATYGGTLGGAKPKCKGKEPPATCVCTACAGSTTTAAIPANCART